MSDTTVSPIEGQSEQTNHTADYTPQATPLPNDSDRLHPVVTETTSQSIDDAAPPVRDVESSGSLPPYMMDGENDEDDDDEDTMPPPIPLEPPPSSTSASSENTPPDIIDGLPPPPSNMPHSASSLSEDFHTENSNRIIAPPEGFLSSSPKKDPAMFTIPKEYLNATDDEEDSIETMRRSPQASSSKDLSPHFRRVRSNPSLSSFKVKMSVISSSGNPVASLTNLDSNTLDSLDTNEDEYVVTLLHSESKS